MTYYDMRAIVNQVLKAAESTLEREEVMDDAWGGNDGDE